MAKVGGYGSGLGFKLGDARRETGDAFSRRRFYREMLNGKRKTLNAFCTFTGLEQ